MQRTTYNEKGEEVTEMLYEDAEPESAEAPADEKVGQLIQLPSSTIAILYSSFAGTLCSEHSCQCRWQYDFSVP